MMKKRKNLRQKLSSGEPVIGTWLNSTSPVIANLLSQYPFDFICIDVEHSPVDMEKIHTLCCCINGVPDSPVPVVRCHGADYSNVKRYLDAGVKGIICPMVETPEQVRTIIDATKYPPTGKRGLGFCAGNSYGSHVLDGFANDNDEIMVAVQIETKMGADKIDSILDVGNIDAVFIGPFDLSASIGVAGNFDDIKYITARKNVLEACAERNIPCGIHVISPDPAEVQTRISEGYRFIAYSLDITMINETCKDFFSSYNGKI